VAQQVEGVDVEVPITVSPCIGEDARHPASGQLARAAVRVRDRGLRRPGGGGRSGQAPGEGEAVVALRELAEDIGGSEPASAFAEADLGDGAARTRAIVAAAPIELSNDGKGLAVVTLARADAFGYRRGIVDTLLISGGIAVALAILVGWALGAWMTRPLRRLSVAARGIAGGSYGQPLSGSYPGEIQELADDLEIMRQEVRRSEDSLRGFVSSAATSYVPLSPPSRASRRRCWTGPLPRKKSARARRRPSIGSPRACGVWWTRFSRCRATTRTIPAQHDLGCCR